MEWRDIATAPKISEPPARLKAGQEVWVKAIIDSVQTGYDDQNPPEAGDTAPDDSHPGYWVFFPAAGNDMLYIGPMSMDKYKPLKPVVE